MPPGSSQVRSGFTTSYKEKKGPSSEGYTHIYIKNPKARCRYYLWPEYPLTWADLIRSRAELLQHSSFNTTFWNGRALIGWTSFTYSLSTHVTVLLSVDICFCRRFVGLFHQGFRVVISAQGAWYNRGILKTVPTFEGSFGNTYTTNLGKRKKKKSMVSAQSGKRSIPLVHTNSSTSNTI